MIDERQEENAALYVLDLLEGNALVAFEAELARHPALRDLVAQLRHASTQFAHTAEPFTPSPGLRDRVLASIAERAATPPAPNPLLRAPAYTLAPTPTPASLPAPARLGPLAWFSLGLAACLAVSTVYFAQRARTAGTELALRQNELNQAQTQLHDRAAALALNQREATTLATRLAALERANDLGQFQLARLAAPEANAPEATALATWNAEKQQGILTIQKLPAINADEDYQLWIIAPGHAGPVSLGTFAIAADGTARVQFQPDIRIDAATHLAISREPKGGSPQPTGAILAIGAI